MAGPILAGPYNEAAGAETTVTPSLPSRIDRYEIVNRLGKGGMGEVYLAKDPLLGRTVAIKMLTEDNDELRERFAREARSAAALNHKNIVTIYDVGEDNGQPFIAMEYLDGETMAEMIRRRAPLGIIRRLELMVELCTGLGYAHRSGIIHRDIKPANLMITTEGTLKILDFGIARLTADATSSGLTRIGTVMGSLHYMSPEQAEGLPVDERSDIFSVGSVLYEVLSSVRAFPGELSHVVLHLIVSKEPRPIREIVPDIDSELERIVVKGLQKNVADRYQKLAELAADLSHAREQIEGSGEKTVVITRTPQPQRDRPSGGLETPSSGRKRIPNLKEIADRRAALIESHLKDAATHLTAGRFQDAIEQCEKAVVLNPDDLRAVELLDQAHRGREGVQVQQWLDEARALAVDGALTGAERLVGQSLQLQPESADALALELDLKERRRERERAAERARAVRAAVSRTRANMDAGAFEAAVRSATEALAFDPSDDEASELMRQARAAIDERERRLAQEADERQRAVDAESQRQQERQRATEAEAERQEILRAAEAAEAERQQERLRAAEAEAQRQQQAHERAAEEERRRLAEQAQEARRLQAEAEARQREIERTRQADERRREEELTRQQAAARQEQERRQRQLELEEEQRTKTELTLAVQQPQADQPATVFLRRESESEEKTTIRPAAAEVPTRRTVTAWYRKPVLILPAAAVILVAAAVTLWPSAPLPPKAPPPTPSPQTNYAQVLARAGTLGDPLAAIAQLRSIPSTANEYRDAQTLLERLRSTESDRARAAQKSALSAGRSGEAMYGEGSRQLAQADAITDLNNVESAVNLYLAAQQLFNQAATAGESAADLVGRATRDQRAGRTRQAVDYAVRALSLQRDFEPAVRFLSERKAEGRRRARAAHDAAVAAGGSGLTRFTTASANTEQADALPPLQTQAALDLYEKAAADFTAAADEAAAAAQGHAQALRNAEQLVIRALDQGDATEARARFDEFRKLDSNNPALAGLEKRLAELDKKPTPTPTPLPPTPTVTPTPQPPTPTATPSAEQLIQAALVKWIQDHHGPNASEPWSHKEAPTVTSPSPQPGR